MRSLLHVAIGAFAVAQTLALTRCDTAGRSGGMFERGPIEMKRMHSDALGKFPQAGIARLGRL